MTQANPSKSRRTVPLSFYDALERLKPEERTDHVLNFIAAQQWRPLQLPVQDGVRANLQGVDLSRDTLKKRLDKLETNSPAWWNPTKQGVQLFEANLQGVNLFNARLQCAHLYNAHLEGAELAAARLEGATADLAHLQGANLPGAHLEGARFGRADFQGATLHRAHLEGATLFGANFQRAELSEAHLEGADLWLADLRGAKLYDTNLQGANLCEAHLEGLDLSNTNLQSICISDAWLDRTRLRQDQLGTEIGDELEAKKPEGDSGERAERYRKAKRAYLVLKQNFESLGDYDAASWAYVRERRMEKWEIFYKAGLAWKEHKWWNGVKGYAGAGNDLLQEAISGFGERPWRVLTCILFVFIGFAFGYGLTNSIYVGDPPTGHISHDPMEWLRFSLGAMTTMVPSAFSPACINAEVAMRIETLLTVALTGLLGFVVGNRIRHS